MVAASGNMVNNPVVIRVSVPECTLRNNRTNQNIVTNTVPEPWRVNNFLLSIIGETDKTKYIGDEVAIAVLKPGEVSKVLRKIRKHKASGDNSPENSSPENQEVLTGLEFLVAVKDNGNLAPLVASAIAHPESVNRFGVLHFGESRDIVNEVSLVSLGDYPKARWLVKDAEGDYSLPHWIDHSYKTSNSTYHDNYSLAEPSSQLPNEAWVAIAPIPTRPIADISDGKFSYNLSGYDTVLKTGVVGLAIAVTRFAKTHSDKCQILKLSDKQFSFQVLIPLDKFLDELYAYTFCIDKHGLIDFIPLRADNPEGFLVKSVIHDVYTNTFVQHNTSKKMGDKQTEYIPVDQDSEKKVQINYRPIKSYKPQSYPKTLATSKALISVTSAEYPGATIKHGLNPSGVLRLSKQDAIALSFAPLACEYRRIKVNGSNAYGLIFPDYRDIEGAVNSIGTAAYWESLTYKQMTVTSTNEAGLGFFLNQKVNQIKYRSQVESCLVFSYGSVAWNGQQKVVTDEKRFNLNECDIESVQTVCSYLGNTYAKVPAKGKEQEYHFLSSNPIRSLFIDNICDHRFICDRILDHPEVTEKAQYFGLQIFAVLGEYMKKNSLSMARMSDFREGVKRALYSYRIKTFKESKNRGNGSNFDNIRNDIRYGLRRVSSLEQFESFLKDNKHLALILDRMPWGDWQSEIISEDYWHSYMTLLYLCVVGYSNDVFFAQHKEIKSGNAIADEDDLDDDQDDLEDNELDFATLTLD
jgi:CRISPR-associated protein Cas5/DevS